MHRWPPANTTVDDASLVAGNGATSRNLIFCVDPLYSVNGLISYKLGCSHGTIAQATIP